MQRTKRFIINMTTQSECCFVALVICGNFSSIIFERKAFQGFTQKNVNLEVCKTPYCINETLNSYMRL